MKKKIFILLLFIVLLNILINPKNKSLVTVFNEDLKTASSDDYKIYTVYTSTDNINTNNLKEILNNFNSKYINIMPYINAVNERSKELAKKYHVMSIPTVVVIKDGQLVDRSVGVKAKEELKAMIK